MPGEIQQAWKSWKAIKQKKKHGVAVESGRVQGKKEARGEATGKRREDAEQQVQDHPGKEIEGGGSRGQVR